jgi:undecaprenyl-diphosphatase
MLFFIGIGILAFAAISNEMKDGETRAFDRHVLLSLRNSSNPWQPLGPRWVESAARDVTALGSTTVLVLIAVSVIVYLLMLSRPRMAVLMIAAVAGGFLLNQALKLGFERPRPEFIPDAIFTFTYSFPSGHSAMSAAVYLVLGILLARIHPQRRVKIFLLSLAILITIAVGISRVYLGVHWPTDVLAGWILGCTWSLICWVAMYWMQHRRGFKLLS